MLLQQFYFILKHQPGFVRNRHVLYSSANRLSQNIPYAHGVSDIDFTSAISKQNRIDTALSNNQLPTLLNTCLTPSEGVTAPTDVELEKILQVSE